MMQRLLPDQVRSFRGVEFDADTRATVAEILSEVEQGGEAALRRRSEELGDVERDAPLLLTGCALVTALDAARAAIPASHVDLLSRTADRIRAFAQAQLQGCAALSVDVDGGRAGHTFAPVETAGCYAPGGRYPLPSSVLMTAVTARVAGVSTVVVATPRPSPLTLAAAGVAQADAVLLTGGAQAIGALAFGVLAPRCDVIVGPGNRFVSAAKQQLAGRVAIDMIAGPSELAIAADDSAPVALVAADLIAQAEHDPDARTALITTSPDLAEAIGPELRRQLRDLPTAATAAAALEKSVVALARDWAEVVRTVDRLAPEHLEVFCEDRELANAFSHYGALFVGQGSAEVFGDYGAGPNHVLPTSGASRATGGLSVQTFLRQRTWLELDTRSPGYSELALDAAALARLEGLEGHARAAEWRLGTDLMG